LAAGVDQNDKDIECPAADTDRHPVREKLAAMGVQKKAAKLRRRQNLASGHIQNPSS
jgi:hypothetical protein